MFARVAPLLLLLLLNVLAIESVGKIHELNRVNTKKWEDYTDDEINEMKNKTTHNLADLFVGVSSRANSDYFAAFYTLFANTNPDMEAQVCEDPTKFNRCKFCGILHSYSCLFPDQYSKLLRSSASQYVAEPNRQIWYWHYDSPSKEKIHSLIKFNLTDKNGIKSEMVYDITLEAVTDGSIAPTGFFFITKIVQGGSCLEHGKFAYSSSLDDEDVEKMQEHPDAVTFLNLFAPRSLKVSSDQEVSADTVLPNPLPSDWLQGLASNAEIVICEKSTSKLTTDLAVSQPYTKEQFVSWYRRLAQMWHLKKGDAEAMKLQIMELKDGALVARVTFKMQIGVYEAHPEHDWNFKIAAKMNDDKTWTITKLDVLCVPTIGHIMDENYIVYRDVVGTTFDLYVNDRKQWYPATDFLNHFKKHNEKIQFRSCKEDYSDVDEIPKEFWVLDRYWNATMIGYYSIDDLDPLPALEETKFRLRVKMQPPSGAPKPGDIFGADWTFYIKWDKTDQFYFIHKVDFSCPKFLDPEIGKFIYLGRRKGIRGTKK
ncbi:hypothetical protein CAEBREN_09686 [Caenorhabditis brenneri]|uniref:NTF2-like domain-containing protein n=1 Tax=Caenorhabditis brenneri TaxID=135651 RepID=G0MMK7_CAEBE|nr:hypothetical protein CAEBREN_09686 [Caenorhabditis brenneri]